MGLCFCSVPDWKPWNECLKGPLWDVYESLGKTFKETNGVIAVDHYHRFKEDVALMAEIGLKAYRFSVSYFEFSRKEINETGLVLIVVDDAFSSHPEPVLTLYHWDLPQALMDEYGRFESRNILRVLITTVLLFINVLETGWNIGLR